jgi:biopolymer transport protein ExbD
MGFVVDMTPLVDITFLLLTFLMFTAQFKSDAENGQDFQVKRPTASADTTFLPEKDIAVVQVGIDTKHNNDTVMTFGLTNSKIRAEVIQNVQGLPAEFQQKAVVRVDSAMLVRCLKATKNADVKNATMFAIDGDKAVFFKKVEDVMEIFRVAKIRTFNYVTDKDRGM